MALIVPTNLIELFSGSIGGTTFARTLAGAGARRRAGPCNATTETQLDARRVQDFVAKQWTLLTKTQQAQWQLAANSHPLPSRIGVYRRVSGFALWMQVGTNLVNAGQVLVTTPPTSWTTPPVLDPSVTATLAPNATTDLTASWNQQTGINSVIVVKATGPTPWGRTPRRDQLRTIANLAPFVTPPISLISSWSAVYGLPPQTTPYQILWEFLPYQRPTGVQGPWIDFVQSTGGPDPSSPPTPGTAPGAAPAIAESLHYRYTGSTTNPAWLALTTSPNISYTIVWTSANITAAPTLQGGPSPSSLTTIATFATTDAATLIATPGWTYYIGMNPWGAATPWAVIFAPTQTATFPFAHLTGDSVRSWLIAEGTNDRLVSDIEYQGPPR